MKITGIKATPVNIPLETPMYWTAGLYPGTSKTIIEVETDEGIVGLGEAPSSHLTSAIQSLVPRLIGKDPLDIAEIESLCVPAWQIVQNTDDSSAVTAFGGLEIAMSSRPWQWFARGIGTTFTVILGLSLVLVFRQFV